MNLLRGGEGLTHIAFKGKIRKIEKVLAALSLGLIYVLVTSALPTRDNVPLSLSLFYVLTAGDILKMLYFF
jgi:hypothetical protein